MSRQPSPGPSSNSHHRDHIIPINTVQQPLQDQHQPHSALHVPSGIPHHLPPPPSQPPATFLMASGNGTSRASSRKGYGSAITATAEDVKYQAKYRELKRKVREIEADNDKLLFKVMQAKRNIQRAKLERAILYERLAALPPTPPPNHTGLPPVQGHGHHDVHGVPPPVLPPQTAPPVHHGSHRHRDSHRERQHEQRHHEQPPYPPPGSTPHQQHQSPPRQNIVQVETDQGPAFVLAGPDGRPLVNENGHVVPASQTALLAHPPSSAHSHGQGHSRRRERRDRERERDREERYEREREIHGHPTHHSQHELGHPFHLEPPPLSGEESRSRSRSAADPPAQYLPPLSPPPAERVHHDIPAHAQVPVMHGSHSHRERPSRSQRERERQREWERERELRQQELLREHETHPHAGAHGGGFASYPDVLPAQPGAPPAQAQLQERDREIRERERGRERAERERERATRRHDLPEIAPATQTQAPPLPPPGSAEMAHAHITPQTSPEVAHREARTTGRAGHASSYHSHHGHGHSHSNSRSHSTSPTSPMGPRYSGRVHNHQRMGPGTNFNREFDLEQREQRERERERDVDTNRPSSSRVPTPPYARQVEGSAHMDEDRDVDMSGNRTHAMDMDNGRDREMSENDNMGAAGTRSVSSLSDEA